MGIELLDKTRKINRLLNDRHSSKVAFADICSVLGQILSANAYVFSSKGKILGAYADGAGTIPSLQDKRGSYIEAKLNERFLNVLSTKENVNLETLGFSKEEAQKKAKEALRMVGLGEEYDARSPFELSGGQKRRVAIAGVLAMNPRVLILDEPTAGLDPKGRDEILDQIERLQKERGITVVLVSHSMEDVARYVDRIIVMNHGEVRFDGTPKEVFRHYKELEEIGLAAPQMTYLMQKLKEKGADVDTDATTVEEAAETIASWLRGQ